VTSTSTHPAPTHPVPTDATVTVHHTPTPPPQTPDVAASHQSQETGPLPEHHQETVTLNQPEMENLNTNSFQLQFGDWGQRPPPMTIPIPSAPGPVYIPPWTYQGSAQPQPPVQNQMDEIPVSSLNIGQLIAIIRASL
jgi:hypothetical protein